VPTRSGTWLVSAWRRTGLVARLATVIGITVFCGAFLYSVIAVRIEAQDSYAHVHDETGELLEMLSPYFAEYAVLGDYDSIQQRLAGIARHEYISEIIWTDNRGHALRARGPAEPDLAPSWFTRWFAVETAPIELAIKAGGTQYGTLRAKLNTAHAINKLWSGFVFQYGVVLAVTLAIIALVTLLLRGNLATLNRLAEAAERFSRGDTRARVDAGGDPQTVAAAGAFNRMADQITELIGSLSNSKDELREQLHFTQELIEVMPNPVFFKNRNGVYLGVNKAWEGFFQRSRERIVGRTVHDLYDHDPVTGSRHQAMDEALWQRPGNQVYEIPIKLPDGRVRHTIYYKATLTRADGSLAGLLGTIIDITERKQAEAALFAEKERAQVTLASIGDGVITTDAQGRIDYVNPVAENITGWTESQARDQHVESVFQLHDGHASRPLSNPVVNCLRGQNAPLHTDSTALMNRQGQCVDVEVSASPIRDRDGAISGAVVVFRDVTQSRALTKQISWQANHDSLTGLTNRRTFEEHLTRAIASAREHDQHHCLLYLDLDQFKVVNDTCGHNAGDELLKQLGPLLQQHIRGTDTLARLGGDEFGVLLERCPMQKAMQIAQGLLDAIKAFRFAWENKFFVIGVSIGVVGIHRASDRLTDVLSKADIACYAAKEAGRNRLHVYQEDDADLAQRHTEMQWVSRINQALEHDRLVLYYQPIVPMAGDTGEGLHFEILVRMREEDGRVIPPGQFMPAAERYNLMPDIDRRVLVQTFEWLKSAPGYLQALHTCSINLSGHSLSDPSFADHVAALVGHSGVPAEKICFEVTETAAISNLARTRELIARLKSIGCRFSLDDFGSGFSSFAYLKTLPVDYLKIDGSFVRHLSDDPIDAAMVQAINQIGHVLGIKTIAEFVENEATRKRLLTIGVDYAQGYGIAAPRPIDDLFRASTQTA
jgi:diguanylate cyclase (GGDEF)-like protein/PAS domain S-box-containing protein